MTSLWTSLFKILREKKCKKSGTESADKKERNREIEKYIVVIGFCGMMLKRREEFMKQCQEVFLS